MMFSDRLYTRAEAARYLRDHFGLRCTAASLATAATRGGGPVITYMGRLACYLERDLRDYGRKQFRGRWHSTSVEEKEAYAEIFPDAFDVGDLPEPEYDPRHTGNPHFDEITKLLDQKPDEIDKLIDEMQEKFDYHAQFDNDNRSGSTDEEKDFSTSQETIEGEKYGKRRSRG